MYITEVVDIYPVPDRKVYVKAIAENSKVVYPQTLYDPPEYGEDYVEAFISILDLEDFYDMDITEDTVIENLVKEYLSEIDYELDWSVIERDY